MTKYNNKWTLVDPIGNLFFSLGMDHVNIGGIHSSTPLLEREGWFDTLPSPNSPSNYESFFVRYIYSSDYSGRYAPCFSFIVSNLKKKWGSNWRAVGSAMSTLRLKSWGFNTIGNWSDAEVYRKNEIPFTLGIAMAGSQCELVGGGKIFTVGSSYDPYDPRFKVLLNRRLQGLKSLASSQWCIGVFVDNELYWDKDFGKMTQMAPKTNYAKKALLAMLKDKYHNIDKLNVAWKMKYKDWADCLKNRKAANTSQARKDYDDFYEMITERYFQTVRDAVHTQLPDKLYLGSRFARVTPTAYRMAAKYCDVVSFNIYQTTLEDFLPPTADDAPLLVGEFHFGSKDRGMFGHGLVGVKSQKQRAEAYKKYVSSALSHKQFVGCHWFQYYDQPTTGRAFDGENANIGYLNTADVPYTEMVDASREVAGELYELRFGKH